MSLTTEDIEKYKELNRRLNSNHANADSFVELFDKEKLDFNVYLPTFKINLQRDYVVSLDWQRELIYSIIKGIPLSPIHILFTTIPFTIEEYRNFPIDEYGFGIFPP